jgi:tRNA pseudouridine55 synthase
MARRRKGNKVDGWILIDKPVGMTSTQVIGRVRRATQAAKLGHGGTLDPEATGLLPIALGEATKTIPWCQDGTKVYRFTVRWGVATTTHDAEGETTATSGIRPTREAIKALLPAFVGTISQIPPVFSALKIDGERAYDLARRGEVPEMKARDITIESLVLIAMPDPDHACFEVTCGKGPYVRALGRDLAEALGTVGHVPALRRTRVGPFLESMAISVDKLGEYGKEPPPSEVLLPVETALDDIPALAVTETQAQLLWQGQPVEAPERCNGTVQVHDSKGLVALGEAADCVLRPLRVFNLNEKRGHDVDNG